MNTNELDKEYYLVNIDGENKHPLLTWGATKYDPFIFPKPIEESDLELPLKIKFRKPYPKQPEFADILLLDGNYAVSEKVKQLFEKMNIYGIQFFPVEIETNTQKITNGYYAFHPWNGISAVDKNNYTGSEVDEDGEIDDLEKFSLDKTALEAIPLEKRLIFHLSESSLEILIHKTVYDAIIAENLTGFSLFRIDEWNDETN